MCGVDGLSWLEVCWGGGVGGLDFGLVFGGRILPWCGGCHMRPPIYGFNCGATRRETAETERV